MTAHTPVPWKYDPAYGAVIACGDVSMMICEPPAQKHRGPNGEPAPAEVEFHAHNGPFIARACNSHADLLEALRECITDHGSHAWRSGDSGSLCRRLDAISELARAAIAKTEGRS